MNKVSFSVEKIENGYLISELYPVQKQRQWYCATEEDVIDYLRELLAFGDHF